MGAGLEGQCLRSVLEPAPQGMGAPQATESTQRNDVEAHRSLLGDPDPRPGSTSCLLQGPQNHVYPPLHHMIRPGWGSGPRSDASFLSLTALWHDTNQILERFYVPTRSVKTQRGPRERHTSRTGFFDYLGTCPTLRRKCACSAIKAPYIL